MPACCVVCVSDQVSSGHESERPWILLDPDQLPQRAELFCQERFCSFLQNDTAHSQVSTAAQLKAVEHLGGNLSSSADYKCTSCPPAVIAVIHKKIAEKTADWCSGAAFFSCLLCLALSGALDIYIQQKHWLEIMGLEPCAHVTWTKLMTASRGSVCYGDAEDFKMSELSGKKIAGYYVD